MRNGTWKANICQAGLIVLAGLGAWAGCGNTSTAAETPAPDYYGVFLLSKDEGLHELRSLTSARFEEKDLQVALESISSDASAYVVVFQKGFDPATASLTYIAPDADPAAESPQVDLMVKPKGEDKYHFVPRTPLKAGIYVMSVGGIRNEPICTFIIGDKDLKNQLSVRVAVVAQDKCIKNLVFMNAAKWQAHVGMGHVIVKGSSDEWRVLARLRGGTMPVCPGGGTYTLGAVGSNATCSIPGHAIGAPPLGPRPPLLPDRACKINLRIMEGAKKQAAMEHGWATGQPVELGSSQEADVLKYVKGTAMPVCPSGGTYKLNSIGTDPICTINGHTL